jgi:hypothetical protein
MSLFKKSQNAQLGDYAIDLANLNPEFKKDFLNEHEERIDHKYKPKDIHYEDPDKYYSYVLQGNGDLDLLDRVHSHHLDTVFNNINRFHHTYNDDWNDPEFNRFGIYGKLHHLFDGGFRVFNNEGILTISGYQVPTDIQVQAIDNFVKEMGPRSFKLELWLKNTNPSDPPKYIEHKTYGWPDMRKYILSLRKSNSQEMTPEILQRIQHLQQFRQPEMKEKPVMPNRPFGGNLTKEEIRSLLKNTKMHKAPNFMRYPGAQTLQNLIKIAQTLDEQNQYIKADTIMNFVKSALSAEQIDWSQPDAYLQYLEAIKSEKPDPIIEEQSGKHKRNPTLERLRNGFYGDIPISDLAKVAEEKGFEVIPQGAHFKFTDKTGRLRTSPNEKHKSGTILIGGHSKNNQGVADYQGARDFAKALQFLGHM